MLEIIVSVLGAFGGAAAVGAVVAKFVSDHVSKEWLQTQKSQLDLGSTVDDWIEKPDADSGV